MIHAETFSSGSNGSFGAILVESGTFTIDLPPDGIIHATSITVGKEGGFFATLKFKRNALNTPVYLLATGDITIKTNADIMVDGSPGDTVIGGEGGPGGFNGGEPGKLGGQPGAGFGPGAGLGGSNASDDTRAGIGGYGTAGENAKDGQIYGSQLLMPMLGGSGGGGTDVGGGGGGGAILVASDTRIHLETAAIISANGGDMLSSFDRSGSGGAIRLIAPIVSGTGNLKVLPSVYSSTSQPVPGAGRIRIDTIDQSEFNLKTFPIDAPVSLSNFMKVFPDTIPRLDIIEAAGEIIPEGNSSGVTINLPSEASSTQSFTIQARDYSGILPIQVVITPDIGDPIVVDTQIDMNTGNPATTIVSVDLPQNIPLHVNAWTR